MGSQASKQTSRLNNGGSSWKAKIKEKEVGATDIFQAIAVAAGAGLVAWGLSKLFGSASGPSNNRKTMKAPGRDYRIYRDDFEHDPASYFRDLRE